MAVAAEDVFEAHGLIRYLPRDEVILDVRVGEHRGDVGVFARDVPRALVVLPVEDGEEVGLLRSDLLGLEVLTLDALEGLFGTDIAPEEHPDELHPLGTPEEALLLPVVEEDDLDARGADVLILGIGFLQALHDDLGVGGDDLLDIAPHATADLGDLATACALGEDAVIDVAWVATCHEDVTQVEERQCADLRRGERTHGAHGYGDEACARGGHLGLMVAGIEEVVGEGVGLVGGEDKHLFVSRMVSYLDALGIVEVHGMVEVRTIDNDAICGSRTLAGASCAAPQEHEEARKEK